MEVVLVKEDGCDGDSGSEGGGCRSGGVGRV